MDYSAIIDEKIKSLSHYGILGQQWYVKNGPPYPLDDKDKSIAEKKYYDPKTLSTQDLRDRIQRYQLEDQYEKLAKKRQNPEIYEAKQTLSKYGRTMFDAVLLSTAIGLGKRKMDEITKTNKNV